jgi:hypothetical protein
MIVDLNYHPNWKPGIGEAEVDWSDPINLGLLGGGWWLMNESAGPNAYDLVYRTATVLTGGGVTWVPRLHGWAINATGTSYCDAGNILNPGTADWSLFAWIDSSSSSGGNLCMIVSKRNSSGGSNAGYQIFQNSSNAISFTFCDGSASRVRVDSTAPDIHDGVWHLIGVVWTRSGNGVIYVDGAAATSGSGSISAQSGSVSNSLALRFFNEEQLTSALEYVGDISQVRIWNRALSALEIQRLYVERFAGLTMPLAESYLSVAAAVSGGPFPHFLRRANELTGGLSSMGM